MLTLGRYVGAAEIEDDGVVELSFRAGTLEDGFDIRVPESELLYYLDRQAYADVLDALRGIATQPEEEETPEMEETTPEPEPAAKPEQGPVGHKEPLARKLQPVTDYQGKYTEQVSPLYGFIFHSILGGNSEYATQIQNLTYTLLNGI